MLFRKKKSQIFQFSDSSVSFIQEHLMPIFTWNGKVDEAVLESMLNIAEGWELDTMDGEGNEILTDYPGKNRNESATDFVSDVSGKQSKGTIDFTDLNRRLHLL